MLLGAKLNAEFDERPRTTRPSGDESEQRRAIGALAIGGSENRRERGGGRYRHAARRAP